MNTENFYKPTKQNHHESKASGDGSSSYRCVRQSVFWNQSEASSHLRCVYVCKTAELQGKHSGNLWHLGLGWPCASSPPTWETWRFCQTEPAGKTSSSFPGERRLTGSGAVGDAHAQWWWQWQPRGWWTGRANSSTSQGYMVEPRYSRLRLSAENSGVETGVQASHPLRANSEAAHM